jgi:hypothetical protein
MQRRLLSCGPGLFSHKRPTQWSEWRRALPICKIERVVAAAIAHVTVMGRRNMLIGGAIVVVAAALLILRPSRPDIALSVTQVEAMQAVQPEGRDVNLWSVTIEATNLTSNDLYFASERTMVKVKPDAPWAKPDRAGVLDGLCPGGTRSFALTVPPGSCACRLVVECHPFCGKIGRFLRRSQVFQRVADHLPRRQIAVEVMLPRAPTFASPKLIETHLFRGADGGGCCRFEGSGVWRGPRRRGGQRVQQPCDIALYI